MENLKKALIEHFDTDVVRVASVGGSATWGVRFPEDIAGEAAVVAIMAFDTPFGKSADIKLLSIRNQPVLRITHQGSHRYKNVKPSYYDSLQIFWVMQKAGVLRVVVDGSAGGITCRQGDIILCDDFVDFHTMHLVTEFSQEMGLPIWKRLAYPFCPDIRGLLEGSARQERAYLAQIGGNFNFERIYPSGTYVSQPAGLFETKAKVEWFKHLGGDVVGMSLGIVGNLARACDMCVGAIHIISNDAEGLPADFGDTPLKTFYHQCALPMSRIVWRALDQMVAKEDVSCRCQNYKADTELSGLPVEGA